MKQLYILIILLLFCREMTSQINLKIGYTADYVNFPVNNNILQDYNASNPWLEKKFNNVHFSHGLQLGIRLKQNGFALDANWERVKNSKEAYGVDLDGVSISHDLEYSFSRFAFGLEGHGKFFGLGANVNYEHFRIHSHNNGSTEKLSIIQNENFGNKIYLIISGRSSNSMSLSLQPYVQIPWSTSDFRGLSDYLGLSSATTTDFSQKNYHFGLSIIFYNGPQEN